MILSICIPVYQFYVENLVSELRNQIQLENMDVEIILIDDASDENFRQKNRYLEGVNYIQLEKNYGRSKIRNLFLEFAKGDYLLFLDCDGKVSSPDFLKNYIEILKKTRKNPFFMAEEL